MRIGDDAGWRGGPLAWQVLIGNWNHILCPKFFNCWYYCIYSCVESDKKVFFGQTNEVMRVRCAWSKCPIVKYYCPPRFMVRRHSIQPGEYCVCSKYFYRDITFFFICGYVLLYVMYINKGKLSHKPGLTLLVVKNYFCWTTMQKGWYFTNSWKTFHINLIWLKLGKNKKYPIWQYFFLKLQGIHQEMIFLL